MKYPIVLCVLAAAAALSACSGEPTAGGERIGDSSTLPPDDGANGAAPPENEAAPEGDDASGGATEPDASDAGETQEEAPE